MRLRIPGSAGPMDMLTVEDNVTVDNQPRNSAEV